MISVFLAPGSPGRTIARFSSVTIEINNDDPRQKRAAATQIPGKKMKLKYKENRKADLNLPPSHTDEFAWNFIV
jgi:hypothetical protein